MLTVLSWIKKIIHCLFIFSGSQLSWRFSPCLFCGVCLAPTSSRLWQRPRSKEVCVEGWWREGGGGGGIISNTTLSPPEWLLHQDGQWHELSLKFHSLSKHKVIISLCPCPRITTFEEKRELKRTWTDIRLLTSPAYQYHLTIRPNQPVCFSRSCRCLRCTRMEHAVEAVHTMLATSMSSYAAHLHTNSSMLTLTTNPGKPWWEMGIASLF